MIGYFLLSTAHGQAFCNRKSEFEHLSKNIQMVRPTLIISTNQKKLLISLAKFGPIDKPTSQDFLKHTNISSTSLTQALSIFLEKDYLYKDNKGFYHILDPLFKIEKISG